MACEPRQVEAFDEALSNARACAMNLRVDARTNHTAHNAREAIASLCDAIEALRDEVRELPNDRGCTCGDPV